MLGTRLFAESYPESTDRFSVGLQDAFAQIKGLNGKSSEQEIDRMKKNFHRSLMKEYPVGYDWWLQDGEKIDWFDGDMASQVKLRLLKLGISYPVKDNFSSLSKAISLYVDACVERREKRLQVFLKNKPEIVFTKFHILRPSYFAYTEGLSDARGEKCFIPDSELSLLRMKGIWGEQELLGKAPEGVFRDPEVHFDGKHILYSLKKSSKKDDFHLYEMNLDTREVKQVTSGIGFADIEGIYLPDDNILFNSTRCGTSVDCWFTEVSNLFICDRSGKYMRQIGFDQVHTLHPVLLEDGRVVYTRWDYNDRGQIFPQPLFQMNFDGTGQAEYYGGNSWFPTTITQPCAIPGSRKVMAVLMGHHNPQHGKLAIIDPEAGRDENEGVMFVAPVRKPEAVRVDGYGQEGEQFQHPFALNQTDFLISYTPLGYNIGTPIEFAIYWMNIDGERELLVADSKISCNQLVLVAPRRRPFQRVNMVDYTKNTGIYYLQNIYEGRSMKGVTPGTVKKLRIVELEYRAAGVGCAYGHGKGGGGHAFSPVGVGNASWDLKKVLGEVDVEPDGSAFFEVPSRKPLYFQALDENGHVVQTMRSWSTLQPGEIQSCVGCHEHKNSVPSAQHPVSDAMNKKIQKIVPIDDKGIRNFGFINEVQPIIDKHCISCHDGVKHPMSLKGDLKVVDNQTKRMFSDAYLNLTHARKTTGDNDSWQGQTDHPEVNWISALSEPSVLRPYSAGSATSNLIKRLKSGHGNTQLSQDEIDVFALWIDLLVPFISDYRQANNWTEQEKAYYDYYDKKREQAKSAERENIREYIRSLNEKMVK